MEPHFQPFEPGERVPLPEPLHERVLALEKRVHELDERLDVQAQDMRGFIERVARELGF